ncbi:MAG: HEAT repeat domain-containing protein [Candidatus Sumerlaeota bacterium]|nr:HEAT repeat domain-containing protein [Candidatus Sumerlaeota bacterium]
MRRKTCMLAAAIAAFAVAGLFAQAQPAPSKTEGYQDQVAQTLAALRSYQEGEKGGKTAKMEKLIRASESSGELRKILIPQMVKFLCDGQVSFAARQFIAGQISFTGLGGAEGVKAAAGLLLNSDEKTAELGRMALERAPQQEAGPALREVLPKAKGAIRIGIINSLGARRDKDAVETLAQVAMAPDAQAAEAALSALGAIGDAKAAQSLLQLRSTIPDSLKPAACAAALRAAALLAAENSREQAHAIYEALYKEGLPEATRVCALRGLIVTDGAKELPRAMEALKTGCPHFQRAAAQALRESPNRETVIALAEALSSLPLESQILALNLLGQYGERATMRAVMPMTRDGDEKIRIAAIAALKNMGDAAIIVPLAQMAASSQGEEQEAARASLQGLADPGVDEEITVQLKKMYSAGQKETEKIRLELIRAIRERRIKTAVMSLIAVARDASNDERAEAFSALEKLAEPRDLPDLLDLMTKEPSAKVQKRAQAAVIEIARQIPEENKRADAVLLALDGATSSEAQRTLVAILGKIGNRPALERLRKLQKSNLDEKIQDAVLRAFSDFPNAAPLDDLLEMAKSAKDAKTRIMALRGVMRLLSLPNGLPPEKARSVFEEALKLAANPVEKKETLAGLSETRNVEALKLAMSYIGDGELKNEAMSACVTLAKNLAAIAPGEARRATQKILESSQEEFIRKSAQEALDLIKKSQGYLTEWQVSGPYIPQSYDTAKTTAEAFAPEEPTTTAAAWKPVRLAAAPDKPALMDFNADRDLEGSRRAAYLRARIWADKEQPARIELGSSGGAKVWLNGAAVHASDKDRFYKADEEKAPVVLKQGWNYLMIKSVSNSGDWLASARLVGSDGKAIEDMMVDSSGVEDTKQFCAMEAKAKEE